MALDVERVDGITIVRLRARAVDNPQSSERFRIELIELIERELKPRIILDVTGVNRVSSLMLGVLVSVWKQLKQSGGDGRLCGLGPDLQALMKTTSFHQLIRTAATREEALSQLQPGR